jgi:outer membrane autotransporter protein
MSIVIQRTCKRSIAASYGQAATVILSMSLASQVSADDQTSRSTFPVIVPAGQVENVDQNTGLDYVLAGPGATLNLSTGAQINKVSGPGLGGVLNINGGAVRHTLNDAFTEAAVMLSGGRINAAGAEISSSTRPAIRLQRLGGAESQAKFLGSHIAGLGRGIEVGAGTVTLEGTRVNAAMRADGEGTGIYAASSKVTIQDNSLVEGDGVGLIATSAGKVPGSGEPELGANSIIIDHSRVVGLSDSAIRVRGNHMFRGIAEITVRNGAELFAENGNLIEVQDSGEVKLIVDNSSLAGNFLAGEGSQLNITLQNSARFKGNLLNAESLTVNSEAAWMLVGDTVLPKLTLGSGIVRFEGATFNQLTLGELSGRGTFDMRVNLDDGTSDLLNVAGVAKGIHLLSVHNTGTEAVPAEFDPLRVVHTEGGDAEFGLVGGRADLGVYSYELERQGTDWFIVGSGKEISPSTQSALALFNTAPTVWNSELTTLRSRMGEVRGQEQGGGWMRTYGSRFNAALDSGVDYSQKQQGLSFGADAPVPVGNGQLLLGLMGGYSKSDLDIGRGTSGQVDSYYVGAYGTWLSEGGYYLDGLLKLNQFHNESKVAMSDGTRAKGDYSSKALGGSLEVGKHIKLGDEYFVEPFAQVSSVWIDGSSYTLDNGMQARTNQTQSVLGKVGSTLGRSFALKDGGVVKPYARVALAHEFSRSNDVSVNGQRFDNDLFGSRAELGAGVSVSLSERLQVHADFDYMKGEHVEQPWGANVGVRLAF